MMPRNWLLVLLLQALLQVVPAVCLLALPKHNAILERTVRNWVSIAQHLQSAELYNATWANACHVSGSSSHHKKLQHQLKQQKPRLVVSQDVSDKAQVLSLYPIHAIYTTHHHVNNSNNNSTHAIGSAFLRIAPLNPGWYRDSGVSDDTRLSIQAPPFSSSRAAMAAATSGWMGHLATRRQQQRISRRHGKNDEDKTGAAANCIVVPLLGAAPLCALVSLHRLKQGEVLIAAFEEEDSDNHHTSLVTKMSIEVLKRYTAEICELRSFTTMAHPAPPAVITTQDPSKKMVFHSVNRNYPGLIMLHKDPDVLQIDNFLTPHECEHLITLARPQLQPCLVKNEQTGAVEQDPTRTNTNANIAQSSIPSVVTKVCALLQCPNNSPDYLEIFQVLHYATHEKFTPHSDGFNGPVTACGFEHSGRLVTLFVYLNTCTAGGETHFTQLKDGNGDNNGIQITPRQGTAVVHFPNSVDLQEDTRTEHESRPVLSNNGDDDNDDDKEAEKWILVTWKWKHPRSDPRYHEALL